MLRFLLQFLKLFLLVLFLSKRDLFLYISTLQKENEILLRRIKSQNLRIKFNNKDRLFFSAISKLSAKIRALFSLVQPETVLKWYRKLIKSFWTFPSSKKKRGRPPTSAETKNLILKIKNDNLLWGNGKIRGELIKLGIELDKRTIANILADFRKKGKVKKALTWKKFLKSNFDSLFAMDFCTVTTLFNKTFYVFFVMYLKTREIVSFGITTNPIKRYVEQKLEDLMWGRADEKKIYLIHDRSGEFCFIDYESLNIEDITTSYKSPNLNAYIERFIGSVRREALDWFIIFSESQLRKIIREYVSYHNSLRHHQGIDNIPAGYESQTTGKIISRPILSGLHNHYYRMVS